MGKEIKNYGFKPPEIVPEDFWLGSGKLGSTVLNEKGDWRDYLPELEIQRVNFEPSACVSFGILNSLEIIHKLLWKVEPNYSDRFTAKMSETDPSSGNTPKKVSESIKNSGLVPEKEWPMTETLKEYYKDIPISVKDIGKMWIRHFGFGYEWVDKTKLKEALKRSPVGVAVSAWEMNNKGEYVYFGTWNHWCVLVAYDELDRPIVWDSYDRGLKTLERNFPFGFPQIYTLKKKEEKKESENWWSIIIKFIKENWFAFKQLF